MPVSLWNVVVVVDFSEKAVYPISSGPELGENTLRPAGGHMERGEGNEVSE
jgi:hypothetical protein